MTKEKRYCNRCGTDQEFEVYTQGNHVLRENSHAVLWGNSHADLWGNSHAVLWGNSHADLWGNSHADLRGNSHADLRENSHADLRGNSHADLRENSHAVLWGNSHADLRGNSHAVAHNLLAVIVLRADTARGRGGIVVAAYEQTTKVEEWADRIGVTRLPEGALRLYKRTAADFSTQKGIVYTPGTSVEAPDWDGGERECGGGLHFCPTAKQCDGFRAEKGDRYVACAVMPEDIVIHARPSYPDKVKARACYVLYECDRDGVEVLQ